MYKDHHRATKTVADVDMWSVLRGHFCHKILNWDLKKVAVIDKWSIPKLSTDGLSQRIG